MQDPNIIEVEPMRIDWGNESKTGARIGLGAAGERKTGQQRRYAPKTRTGCITCKVKCDEQKPFCKRCTTTGRKCDGYAPLSPPSDSSSPRSPEPLTVALVNSSSTDALERRTFDFFRAKTAPCVSGYFQDAVWDRIVLQLSHSEPAVRHAVTALAALHEEKLLRNDAGNEGIDVSLVRTGYPVQQYAKALNEMQALMRSKSVSLDLIMLCALLCIHFESMRESFVSALTHIESAISLLNASTTFDARKVNPALVRALMRLDLQGTMYLGMRVPGLPFYTDTQDAILPNTFHDLTQARDLINTWTSRVFHFMRTVTDEYKFHTPGNVPLEILGEVQRYEQTFLTLDQLLWDYMHKPTVKLSIREQHGLGVLRGRVKMNRVLAATCVYSELTMFDQYMSEFQDILTICQYIMGSDNADRRLLSISLDEGLIHPLFFIATHCRDSRMRHQALVMLRKIPPQDGIWHVETTIRTAELCINFEEQLCEKDAPSCEDIPEWRRIHCAHFNTMDLDFPRRSVRVILRTRPNGLDGEWTDIEELMECSRSQVPMDDLKRIYEIQDPVPSIRFKQPRIITWG